MASGANTQTAHFPFAGGLDERTHPRHLQPPKLRQCLNGRFTRGGAISRRPGNAELAAIGTGTNGTRLTSYRDELLVHDRRNLLAYTLHNDEFQPLNYAQEAVPSMRGLVSTMTGQSNPDMTYNTVSGLITYAWSDATSPSGWGRVRTKVVDAATGAEIQSATIVETASSFGTPRVASVAGYTVLVYNKQASGNIYGRVLSSDGKTWSATTTIKADNSTANRGAFEICSLVGTLFLVYQASTPAVKVCSISAGASSITVNATRTTTETLADIFSFGIATYAGDDVVVSYCCNDTTNDAVRVLAVNQLMTTETLAPLTLLSDAGFNPSMSYPARLAFDSYAVVISSMASNSVGGGSASNCIMSCNVTFSTATATDPADRRTYWCALASKPFLRDSVLYAWAFTGGTRYSPPVPPKDQSLQFSLTLVDVLAYSSASYALMARPVCVEAPRFAYRANQSMTNAPSVVEMDAALGSPTRTWRTVGEVRRTNNGRNGFVALDVDFAHPNLGQPAQLGEALQCAPGYTYDGARAFEYSFCHWPQEVDVAFVAGGGLTVGKKYRWRSVYVFIDDTGQVHRSAPSDYTEATATDTQAELTTPMICLTNKQQAIGATLAQSIVGIEFYRTTENPTDDTPYYLIHDVTLTPGNEPSEQSVAFFDDVADSLLSTHEQIYTQGGVLRHVQPPSFQCQTTYRGRIWGAHGSSLWYSGAFVEGEAPWWSDTFVQPIDTPETITALWVMDDTLYASTRTAIYYLQGDGPTDTGAQNDIVAPYRVATDLGCIEPRSVVVTPIGTLYQSAVGIHLLNRARQVPPQVFGLRVQDTLAAFPTIVAAVVHPHGGYVLFFCSDGGTGGRRLVYDYTADEWATDGSILFGALRSAAIDVDTVVWMNDATVFYETANYLDGTTPVLRTIELADFHPTGSQGFMKFIKAQLLTEAIAPQGFTIQVAKDYSASYFETFTFTDTELDANGEQIAITPSEQRCQAMRLLITDTPPDVFDPDDGRGHDLIAISFDFDPLGNQFQLPSGARK